MPNGGPLSGERNTIWQHLRFERVKATVTACLADVTRFLRFFPPRRFLRSPFRTTEPSLSTIVCGNFGSSTSTVFSVPDFLLVQGVRWHVALKLNDDSYGRNGRKIGSDKIAVNVYCLLIMGVSKIWRISKKNRTTSRTEGLRAVG